jgi:hypothetical protein
MENFKEEMTILMTFERGREKERREISREWCGNQKMRCRWLKFVVRPHFMTVAFWFIVLKSRLLFFSFFLIMKITTFSLFQQGIHRVQTLKKETKPRGIIQKQAVFVSTRYS